jgi:hypothetical protein
VIEVTLRGNSWTEIDRQTTGQFFGQDGWVKQSFPVANAGAWRYIRLTQTGFNYFGTDVLSLAAVEFFGTLLA